VSAEPGKPVKPASVWRSLRLPAFILAAVIIYAYGFQVTDVNLDNIRSEERQTRLVRIIRALFRPDLVEYDREEFTVTAPIAVPCPAGEPEPAPQPASGEPYLVITPPCADPRTEVTVEGFNFEPNTKGPLNFIPPSGVKLKMADISTDDEGHFRLTARLPNRPTDAVQSLSAITRRNVGSPHLSRNGLETWNKIIETIFLALLATTLATALAVPLSFLAARNLMRDITTSLPSIALAILAWPVGIVLGAVVAGRLGDVSRMLTGSAAAHLGGLILAPLFLLGTARFALPPVEARSPGPALRLARQAALLAGVLAGVLALYLLAQAASTVGDRIQPSLGPLAFLGEFIADLGDILGVLITPLAAIASGALLGSLASRLGQALQERLPGPARLVVHFVLGALGGAVLFGLIGAGIGWLYEIKNPLYTRDLPLLLGALGGLAVAYRTRHGRPVAVGLTIYYVVRTIFNTLRSIEALIVAIVMVVWVGLGPFAGALALALHSIAAGGKLYSEQVESIMAGPLEAIRATGATRLQTVIYAVIPQIIPPYISFTMYRWDINVRMSTIIGFVGGGGIGFLLQQNMNLLNYRGAAAQILAIAIVVATMDYVSSRLRERAI
jgi:phosphonate ABC transporter permease subunit PhnE